MEVTSKSWERFQNQYRIFCSMPESVKQSVFRFFYDSEIRRQYPNFLTDISCYLKSCKSQIEMTLAIAYVLVITKDMYSNENPYEYWQYSLEPQAEIEAGGKTYYADFFYDANIEILPGSPFKLVIECDGHDYHHASKEQVQKDYERETNLKMAGYDVLRFTGSQIYKDPIGCAKTIFDYIKKKVGEEDG